MPELHTPGIAITRYGLHEHAGVQYLHQHGPGGHNFLGLKRESPFELIPTNGSRLPMCPHNFNPSVGFPDRIHWTKFIRYVQDPFFLAFVPLPKQPGEMIPYLDDPDDSKIGMAVLFSRLASPTAPLVLDMEHQKPALVLKMLVTTNLAPLVLCGIEPRHQMALEEIVKQASYMPRRLILMGKPSVIVRPPMKRIKSMMDQIDPLTLIPLPLETLGTVALRRFARGEQFDQPMHKKDEDFYGR